MGNGGERGRLVLVVSRKDHQHNLHLVSLSMRSIGVYSYESFDIVVPGVFYVL